jgi:hypothetical protein
MHLTGAIEIDEYNKEADTAKMKANVGNRP